MTTLQTSTSVLRTSHSPPPRFNPDLSIDAGGFATPDLDVSGDRTHTGKPTRA
jgi:hypothetical protein